MARKFGLESLVDSATAYTEATIRSSWPFIQKGDSPIEELFFASLYIRAKVDPGLMDGGLIIMKDIDTKVDIRTDSIRLWRQRQLIDWPVDFVCEIDDIDGVTHTLAVECDGHEFHERTKEQASRDRARDRALQRRGVKVFRFTGSEIWRDPWRCASEVVTWAEIIITS